MRIVCPSCQAAYEVPEKLLSGAPRKVRCARCGDSWIPEAAAAPVAAPVQDEATPPREPDPIPDPEPEPEPPAPMPVRAEPLAPIVIPRIEEKLVPDPAEPPPGRGPAIIAASAWAASVAVLLGAGWAFVTWRADIMALWAPSRRLFALFGLG